MKQINSLEANNKDLELKIEELKKQCSKLQMSVELQNNQREHLDKNIRLSKSKVFELENVIQSMKTERENAYRDLLTANSKLSSVEASYQKSLERTRDLEHEKTRLHDTINSLESEVFASSGKYSQVSQKNALNSFEILFSI
mgnify:CR=1 FL=1